MKKLVSTILLTVCCLVFFTGYYSGDNQHAAVTVSVSDGRVGSWSTFTATSTLSGEEWAVRNPIKIPIHEGDTVTATLTCSACECDKEFTFDSFGAKTIYCDCPTDDDSNESDDLNLKEFACILVLLENDEESTK